MVFFKGVEIARIASTPLKGGSFNCKRNPPVATTIGPNCYNLSFSYSPRSVAFSQEDNGVLNLYTIKIGDHVDFRTNEGDYLVFKVFEKPPIRETLLLQVDDTIATPLPGTPVAIPSLYYTESKIVPILPSSQSENNPSFINEWVRPFLISMAIVFIFSLLIKDKRIKNLYENIVQALNNNHLLRDMISGVIATVIGTIIIKFMGL